MDEESRFTHSERLHKRSQYLEVYGRGRKIHTSHLVLYLLENSVGHHRLGITVSRKIGKAAVRNWIKRRIREIFRRNKPDAATPWDIVVNVKRSAVKAPFQELLNDFRGALNRREEGRRE